MRPVTPTRRAVLGAPMLLALPRTAPAETYAALLAEEHAAIHLYGLLAPRLPDRLQAAARVAYDDHRRHRDHLVSLIRAAGGVPDAPRPAYAPPFPLSSPSAARTLALRIEDSLALRWHEAVRVVAPGDRIGAARALGDEAVHLASLRGTSVAFPGR